MSNISKLLFTYSRYKLIKCRTIEIQDYSQDYKYIPTQDNCTKNDSLPFAWSLVLKSTYLNKHLSTIRVYSRLICPFLLLRFFGRLNNGILRILASPKTFPCRLLSFVHHFE